MKEHDHLLDQHDPERRDFQIERLILFTDAVFAIAITLLIIEIKVPEGHHKNTHQHIVDLLHMIPKFIGFIMSFFVIAIYWRSHHRIFGFVTSFTEKLIWMNMLFLFTVVLMPFSSAYFSEYQMETIPYVFYNANVVIMALVNYRIISYVFNPANKIVTHMPSARFLHLFKMRAIAIPAFFFCCLSIALIFGAPFPIIYFLIWPMMYVLNRYNKRKFEAKPVVANEATAE
ncbi:TMEM175 family protein [Mucilaginibacter calamicampi]|uniref:TMEM175 family protein n=1 Tax=Mucilaginibacter calamicampi TaxID=1302352 RepID=A0ABW2YZ99_9SPHI